MAIDIQIAGSAAPGRPFARIVALFGMLRRIMRQHEAEAELAALSDRCLRDIGVERPQISETVAREIDRASLAQIGWPGRSHLRQRDF